MQTEFENSIFDLPQNVQLFDPYLRVNIERRDLNNLIYKNISTFDTDYTNTTTVTDKGITTIGLKPKDKRRYLKLDKDITISTTGYYRVYVRALRRPEDKGQIKAYIDDVKIDEGVNVNFTWGHVKRFDLGLVYLTKGTHNFAVRLDGFAYVEKLILQRVELYSSDNISHGTVINPSYVHFTQNGINEVNGLELEMATREYLFDDTSPNNLIFKPLDPVTVYLGGSRSEAKPMFGGYISGNEEPSEKIRFLGQDRMLDLRREPIFFNYAIGGATWDKKEKYAIPFLELSNVFKATKFLIDANEMGIDSKLIDYQYGMKLDFSDDVDVALVTTNSVFSKTYEGKIGNPAPSLSFGLKKAGNGEIVLFDAYRAGGEFDASYFNMFSMKYRGQNPSLKVDLKVRMYKAGEEEDEAIDYIVSFNGKNKTRVIGSITPKMNGSFNLAKIDLGAAFDAYVPSTNYYVTKISLIGTVTKSDLSKKNKSKMYIDDVMVFDSQHNISMLIQNDVNYPFDTLKELFDKSGLIGKFEYGNDRRDDMFILSFKGGESSSKLIVEGDNFLGFNSYTYEIDDVWCNQSSKQYKVSEKKTGSKYYQDELNVIQNGPFRKHESLDDVTDGNVALKNATDQVNNGINVKPGYVLDILGTVLIDTGQMVTVQIPSKRIYGSFEAQSVEYEFDISSEMLLRTSVGLNRPTRMFVDMMRKWKSLINKHGRSGSKNIYTVNSLERLGITNPGGFILQ